MGALHQFHFLQHKQFDQFVKATGHITTAEKNINWENINFNFAKILQKFKNELILGKLRN